VPSSLCRRLLLPGFLDSRVNPDLGCCREENAGTQETRRGMKE